VLSLCFGLLTLVAAEPAAEPPTDDVARDRPYTMVPPPNYRAFVNQGDATDLTDGVYGEAHVKPGSVVWTGDAAVRIDIALSGTPCGPDGAGCPAIGEIFFQVLARPRNAALCPRRVVFEVSDDGVAYHGVRELTRPDNCAVPNPVCSLRGGPESGKGGPGFEGNYIVTSGPIQTRGARVRLTIEPQQSLVLDEIVVRPGKDRALTGYLPQRDFDAGLRAFGPDWRVFPSGPWDAVNARSLPAEGARDAEAIAFALAGGETGAAALRVTNPYPRAIALDVEVSSLQGPQEARLPASTIVVRQAIDVPTEMFEPRADALVTLAHAPARLAPRSVGHLFFDATVPSNQPAGTYRGTLRLTCRDCAAGVPGTPEGGTAAPSSKTIPLALEVRPFSLPPRSELKAKFFDWSYSIPENQAWEPGAYADERAALRAAYGENADVVYLTPVPAWQGKRIKPPDFKRLDVELKRESYSRLHLLVMNGNIPDTLHFQGHACYPGKEWTAAYSFWVGTIREFMESRGLTPGQYALYLMDEPRVETPLGCLGENCATCKDPGRGEIDFIREAAAIVHAKGLKVFVNPTESWHTGDDGLASLAGLVDLWGVPADYFDWERSCLDPSLFPAVREFYERRQAAGDAVFAYNSQPGISRSSTPAAEARLTAWRTFRNHWAGYGYWALYAVRQERKVLTSLWEPFDDPPSAALNGSHDWGTIYLTRRDDPSAPAGLPEDEGIIPSRRLAAWRQGIEDYRYLDRLQRLLDARRSARDVSAPEAALRQAVDDVLASPGDPAVADRARNQVAAAIQTLLEVPARN
jgi:hypothetical protein